VDEGTGHGDPLLLATRQVAAVACGEGLELDEAERFPCAGRDLGKRPSSYLQG